MKSINQIFSKNKDLLDCEPVKELVEYCRELEEQVIETEQIQKFSFEDKLTEVVRDIFSSINKTLQEDENAKRFRETPQIDFYNAVKNLKIFLLDFAKNNKFRL